MKLTAKLMRLGPLLALAGGLALAPHAARAQSFTFAFSPSTQTAAPSGSADFTGVFINSTGSDYFITGGTFSGDPRISAFFNGDLVRGNPTTGAFEVLNGQTATVSAVFTLSADMSLPAGTYPGAVDFSGETAADYAVFQGGGMDNSSVLGNAPLSLRVAAPAVPEASTKVSLSLLLALGLGGLVVSARRRKVASAL